MQNIIKCYFELHLYTNEFFYNKKRSNLKKNVKRRKNVTRIKNVNVKKSFFHLRRGRAPVHPLTRTACVCSREDDELDCSICRVNVKPQ